MDTLQWLLNEIGTYLADLFFSLLKYSILFGVIGLIGGLAFVFVAGKKGLFRRPNRMWRILAALNYGYIPLVLVCLGVSLGVVYGTHVCVGRFVDNTAKPMAKYGQAYMTQAMQLVPEIPWAQYEDQSLDQILALEMAQQMGVPPGSEAHQYFCLVNEAVVKHALDEAGVSNNLRDPLAVLRALQNQRLASNAFIGLPRTIHEQCDAFFLLKYGGILLIFLPFLLLPLAEYVIYRLSGRVVPAPTPTVSGQPRRVQTVAAPLRTQQATPLAETSETPIPIEEAIVPAATLPAEPEKVQAPVEPAAVLAAAPPAKPVMASIPETPAQSATVSGAPPPSLTKSIDYQSSVRSHQPSFNMNQSPSSSAVTYILGGALLQLYAGIGSGWLSIFIAIFGFIVFYLGLDRLKSSLDFTGQSAVSLLKMAAIVGGISAFIDLVPLLGVVASLGYMAAFVMELIGFVKLKNSQSIGRTGQSGATFLLVAMILAVLQALLGLLPFVGGFLAAPIGFMALVLAFFGWVRIQEGMHEVFSISERNG